MNEMPEPAYAMGKVLPEDRYNAELVANVHPPGRENPEPAERYHLVVLGAGTAGALVATGQTNSRRIALPPRAAKEAP